MPVNLTEGAIDRALAEVAAMGKRRDLSDARHPGLRLRLTPKGAATWVLACRDREGRMRRFVLGQYSKKVGMGLADARGAARNLYVQVKTDARDPVAERQKARAIGKDAKEGIGTLAGLLDLYEAKRAVNGDGKKKGKLKSWKAQRQSIEHVFAKHLNRPLATMAVMDLRVTASSHKAVYSAALAVRCIRPMLRWAADLGLAPPGLSDIQPPATVQRRNRVLSPDELSRLLPVLRASSRSHAAAMRFMLGSLARREEVCGARWRDIDLKAGTWTLAATKNDEPHAVPLPRQMVELLRARLPLDEQGKPRKSNGSALIFSTSAGAPLGNWDREGKKLAELSGTEGWTRHDLRRTGATMLGEMGELPDIIEAALNHVTIHSPLAATYNRSRYRPQVATALQRLADALDGIEAKGAVVAPIPG